MSRRAWFMVAAAGTISILSLVQAQDNKPDEGAAPPPAPGRQDQDRGAGRRGRRGNFDPAQIREQMMNNMKEELGVSDEAWKGLMPKVQRVGMLQRELRPIAGENGRRFRGENDEGESKVAQARDLQNALKDKTRRPMRSRTSWLRCAAHEKARTDLQAAQKELKSSVNARGEAVLVLRGLLD